MSGRIVGRCLGTLLALVVLVRPVAAGDDRWAAWVGAGATGVDAAPGQFVDGALPEQGATAIGSLGGSHRVLRFFRVGVRGSYFRLETAQARYCRTTCVPVGGPSRIDVFPAYAAVEGDWAAARRVNLYVGGGYGRVWTRRSRVEPAKASFGGTDRHPIVTTFAGVLLGQDKVRAGFEVAWHRASDFQLERSIVTPALSGFEITARLELRR